MSDSVRFFSFVLSKKFKKKKMFAQQKNKIFSSDM